MFQGKSEQIEQLHRENISLERIVTMQESAKPKDYAERMDAQKLPFKANESETDYANRVKAVFKSVHIFIYSDTEADVSIIRDKFNEWRKRL